MKIKTFLQITLLSLISFSSFSDEIINLEYSVFSIRYNCDMRGYDSFEYETVPDSGNIDRYKPFHLEKGISQECSQKTTNTYKNYAHTSSKGKFQKAKSFGADVFKNGLKNTIKSKIQNVSRKKHEGVVKNSGQQFDRGHGVHQNIWDHNKAVMRETNSMANIVPQDRTLNRSGLWRHLEILTECYRDENDIRVVGGNYWGNDSSNDFFIKSHGIVTPDYLYKVLMFNESKVFAFIMPNNSTPKASNAMNYITTIEDIESKVGYSLKFPAKFKNIKASTIPRKPKYCSLK